jgi:hypothetical protein
VVSCTPILPNASPQSSFTSVIYGYGPWCTTFATSLILDSAILPCTVYATAAREQFTKLAVSRNASTLGPKANDHAFFDVV